MLSVVIATKDSERTLLPTLAALVAGAAAGVVREVIIADPGSRDQTAQVADIAGCRIIVSSDPLAARLKAAAASARAPWLMFLRPGVVLDVTWTAEAARFIEQAEQLGRADARAAVFRPAPAGQRAVFMEALALMRLSLGGRPRPEQGLMIARSLYDSLEGHRIGAPDPENDLIRRIGHRRIIMLRSTAVASDG